MRFTILFIVGLFCCVQPGVAQSLSPSARSFVESPQALGMGDAVVALPVGQSGFFYNPAHIAHAPLRVTIFGVRASISTNLADQVSFFKDDLKPAIDEGIDNLDNNELTQLYDRALDVGRQSAFIHADVLAPSASFHIGPLGVGVGIFGQSSIRYNFPDGGGGLPYINLAAVADAMALGSAGIDLSKFGVSGLTAGITAKYTRRFATLKNKPIDVLGSDEPFYLLQADRMSLDAGFLYELPVINRLPGTIRVGLALYDVLGPSFDFEHAQTIQGADDQTAIDKDIAAANTLFTVDPSFRFGFAYELPRLPGNLISESGVTLDYVGYQNPQFDQTFFTHLRIGVQAKVKVLALRAGLNQGYPTVGGGVSLGFLDFDYAYYGVEQGRYPGQLPSWHHAVQLRLGL